MECPKCGSKESLTKNGSEVCKNCGYKRSAKTRKAYTYPLDPLDLRK